VSWAIHGGNPTRSYGGGEADALPARGALGTRLRTLVTSGRVRLLTGFSVHTVQPDDGGVRVRSADGQSVTVDRIISATGFRPDHSIAAELRLDLDPIMGASRRLAPLIDPNEHSCGTVPPHGVDELSHPELDYYAVGVKSYGRAPTFLLATGYEQARSVVAALAGDWQAARDVQLDLPATGVCSSNLVYNEESIGSGDSAAEQAGCCGAAPVGVKVGLATGVAGGLLAQPLVSVGGGAATEDSCCG
jgi:hypothetical protein